MIMLFEDKITSGISKLILHAYSGKDKECSCVYFADGNLNLTNKLEELKENKNIIVYVDVMPDKSSTIAAYKSCRKWVKDANRDDIFIIPIPCIEYYVVKSFFDKDAKEVRVVVNFEDYRSVPFNSKNKQLSICDFESYCKSVVDNYRGCFRTNGVFYSKDCLCKEVDYLKHCTKISVMNKAWKLILSLPAFVNNENNTFYKTQKVLFSEIENECIDMYNIIAKKYLDYGIIDYIQKLR